MQLNATVIKKVSDMYIRSTYDLKNTRMNGNGQTSMDRHLWMNIDGRKRLDKWNHTKKTKRNQTKPDERQL